MLVIQPRLASLEDTLIHMQAQQSNLAATVNELQEQSAWMQEELASWMGQRSPPGRAGAGGG